MEHRAPEVQDVTRFIALFAASDVQTHETWELSRVNESTMGDKTYIKLADAVSKHEGIKMEESKTEGDTDWLNAAITTFVGIGLGLIPYVGPFLALGYDAVNDYLTNPAAWKDSNTLKLSAQTTAEMVKSATDILKYYKGGKVPHIRFRSHLEEGDRQPIYVGERAQPPQSTDTAKGKEAPTAQPKVEDPFAAEKTYWGQKAVFFDKAA